MGPKQFATFALPARGDVIVGRGGGTAVDVKLEDTKASRRHLRLHVGQGRTTTSRSKTWAARTARASTTASWRRERACACCRARRSRSARSCSWCSRIGRRRRGRRGRIRLSHAEFEGRVEWECARAEATGGTFSVARVRAASDAGARLVTGRCSGRSTWSAGSVPANTSCSVPGLAGDTARVLATAFARRGRRRQAAAPRVGVASYPDDGRHAAALLASAARARAAKAKTHDAGRRFRVRRREHAAGAGARRAGRRRRHQRADPGRDRRRQGGAGARHPRGVAARREAVRRHQLRGAVADAARERAVRPRARRVHRRGAGQARPARDRARRHRVPRRDRRAAAAPAGQAPARHRDARGAARRRRPRRARSTCASSPPPTATSRRRWRAAASGATSTSG